MARARLRVALPDGRWKTDVSRTYPDLGFRFPSVAVDDGRACEVVVLTEPPDRCLSDMEAHPDVDAFDVLQRRCDGVTVQLETVEPSVLSTAVRSGTPLTYPLEVYDGKLTVDIVSTHANISALGDQLRADGLRFELAHIQSDHDATQVLTDRQEEVLFTAVEHGYYRSPRECTLTELAGELGIAKSTCSGTLQRAERAMVDQFLAMYSPHRSVAREEPESPPTESSRG